MKRLQVKINNEWKYVFCRNERKDLPIITDDKLNAIKGDKQSKEYFENHFGTLEFRII